MDKQNIEQLLRESGGIIRLQGREYVTFGSPLRGARSGA